MKKKVALSIALGVVILFTNSVSGQTVISSQEKESTVHVSFIPPLSTNGSIAGEYTNLFSFNMLVGISKNEKAFTLGGLANIIRNNSAGFQLAGLGNYVGNEGSGVLFSGLTNIVKNSYSGAQVAGLLNISGAVAGFQLAGLGNCVGNEGSGVLFSGLTNIVKNSYSGAQVAGLINVSGDVDGFQFAGLINIAKEVSGVQFAGLLNIADRSDYPIGLINIIKEGEMSIAATYNEIGTAGVTFRSGGKVTYGILGVGYNHRTKGDAFTSMGGLGAHININSWLRVNNEITIETLGNFSDEVTFKAGYALMPAFRIGQHVELFGGPSIIFMQTDDPDNYKLFPSNSLWEKERSSKLQQLFVGYQVGMQFLF